MDGVSYEANSSALNLVFPISDGPRSCGDLVDFCYYENEIS